MSVGRYEAGKDVCRVATSLHTVVGQPCDFCGHSEFVHPGVSSPSLEECAVCRLLFVIDQHSENKP